ncbi:MAG TPA: AMP-binding protein [bacterium]|jgi:long-chain acyl-CoA synthetase|nr:AMP-binding protein [bacterium]
MSTRPWTSSYASGTPLDLPPLAQAHLAPFLRAHAAVHGPQPAFSTVLPGGQTGTLSFAELDARSDAFAVFLREELKLRAGDRVALQLPNCLAFPIAAFGVLKAGLVLVNTNPLYTPTEMAYQFKDSGAKALVISDLFANKLKSSLDGTAVEHVVCASLTEGFPLFTGTLVRLVMKYVHRRVPKCPVPHREFGAALALGAAKLRQGAGLDGYIAGQGPDSLAVLQYTGGTTGVSKGAMLSHGNLLSNVEQAYQFCKHRIVLGQEVVLAPLPLYHVFAFTVNLLTFYRTGAHGILIPSPRPPYNLKAAFKRFDVTWMCGVNTLYAALLNEPWFQKKPPRSLKVSIAGGAALLGAVAERWKQLLGESPTEGYGLSEASPVVCFNPLGQGRIGCIGVPLPGTDVKLLLENGSEAGPGEIGELCVRGPQVMRGYWQRPEESAQVLQDGWLRTGDVAGMEPDGFLRIVDRLKDLVVVSGFKVFPNEVEDCLAKLEGVRMAAVVGAPDGDHGEQVVAFVVADPAAGLTEAKVREHCRLSLTGYKVPKKVVFADDLPKSNIGKILRKDLKAEAAKAVQTR